MKSTVFVNLLTIFLVSVLCSEDKEDDLNLEKTLEGLKITNNPISFSFNKKDYSDFKCNFNDEILTHENLMKPPFYHSISTSNFFSIFCYIFQYSVIIHDKEFKKIIENLFECYLGKIHALENSPDEFVYNPLDFKNHLVNLENKICELISGQNKDYEFVNVEENEGRIIITPKELSKMCQFRFIEEFVKDLPPVDSDPIIDDAMIEFYIKYGEAFLQDQFPEGYFKSLHLLIQKIEKEKNDEIREEIFPFNDSIAELLEQLRTIFNLMTSRKNEAQKSITEHTKKNSAEVFKSSFQKYLKIFARKHFSGELPSYLIELSSKVKTKVLLTLSEDSEYLDVFVGHNKETIQSLFSLKNTLFKIFKDPEMIDYGCKKLSNESIENLVKTCLNMDI